MEGSKGAEGTDGCSLAVEDCEVLGDCSDCEYTDDETGDLSTAWTAVLATVTGASLGCNVPVPSVVGAATGSSTLVTTAVETCVGATAS